MVDNLIMNLDEIHKRILEKKEQERKLLLLKKKEEEENLKKIAEKKSNFFDIYNYKSISLSSMGGNKYGNAPLLTWWSNGYMWVDTEMWNDDI